ncbi:MAG: hypothetical protein ACYDHP_13490 [Ferrimicrobium sp.]
MDRRGDGEPERQAVGRLSDAKEAATQLQRWAGGGVSRRRRGRG